MDIKIVVINNALSFNMSMLKCLAIPPHSFIKPSLMNKDTVVNDMDHYLASIATCCRKSLARSNTQAL